MKRNLSLNLDGIQRLFGRGLQFQIIIYIMTVAVVTGLSVTAVSIFSSYKATTATVSESFKLLAEEVSKNTDFIIHEGVINTTNIAGNPVISDPESSDADKLQELTRLKNIFGDRYDDITLVSTQGRVITSTDYNYRGDWTKNSVFDSAKQGQVVLSKPQIIPRPFKLVFQFMAPVYGAGGFITSVVVLQYDMQNIWNELDSVTLGTSGYVMLIDDENRIIFHPNKDKIFANPHDDLQTGLIQGQSNIEYTESGTEIIANYFKPEFTTHTPDAVSQQLGWTVVVAQNKDEAFIGIINFIQSMTYTSALVLLMTILVSTRLAAHLVKPLKLLVEGTKQISSGELDYHITDLGHNEIGELGREFNNMTFQLNESYTALDGKVKERTQELEKTKTELEEKVKKRTEEIQAFNTDLEQRVTERTDELELKMTELQKTNEIMINRELKMIELKDKIKELENTQALDVDTTKGDPL